MGSGASKGIDSGPSSQSITDIEKKFKTIIAEKDKKIKELSKKVENAEKSEKRLEEVLVEIEKLKSVINQTTGLDIDPHAAGATGGMREATHKVAISAEAVEEESKSLVKHPKTQALYEKLMKAISENRLFSNLDENQLKEMVEHMYEVRVNKGDCIMKQGDQGDNFYVSVKGEFKVTKIMNKVPKDVGSTPPFCVFGELAVLYNCTRTATLTAVDDSTLYALDRNSYRIIMKKTQLSKKQQYKHFLRQVSVLKDLSEEHATKIADCLEDNLFQPGDYIIRQGDIGDTFYIIQEGEVRVTIKDSEGGDAKNVRSMGKGSFFGEKALLSEDRRTANVIAVTPVSCLVLERSDFQNLLGPLEEINKLEYKEQEMVIEEAVPKSEWENLKLEDLTKITTLGCGGFGRVELVKESGGNTFALKCLKKAHIVQTRQEGHVLAEKKIMKELNHPFIIKLFTTFKDKKYLYLLMEVGLGGEMWTILRNKGSFDDKTARFFVGCVILGFEYLHGKNIIFRDLKPENLLIDQYGYVKIVDFGFAKKLNSGEVTFTFCGTPEYVAPEIILNKGHSFAADYWALGILMFELLTGKPPFVAEDHMEVYTKIVEGVDRVHFPRKVTKNAHNLMTRLCRPSPNERLGNLKDGIKDIKKHKWYMAFDWDGLLDRSVEPPFVPKINSPTDASNFDRYPPDEDVPPDDNSGWDADF